MSTSGSRVSRRLQGQPCLAVETPEGAGAVVRRSIGGQTLRKLDPFLMLDHFKVSKGAGFPDHPHRGMSTVTYMLDGYFQHEDSVGNKGTIGPGDLQWMTAGAGILHAEMPLFEEGMPDAVGLQLWVDLPNDKKMTAPSYQELTKETIPSAHPSEHVTIKVIAGESQGSEEEGLVKSPITPIAGTAYYDVRISKSGESVWQDIPAGWTAFIYTLKGNIYLGPSGSMVTPLKPNHTIVLSAKEGQNGILVEAASEDVHFVIIAGEPMNQPVIQYGPMVAADQNGIRQAFTDYQLARNGFESAKDWASDIGGRKIKA